VFCFRIRRLETYPPADAKYEKNGITYLHLYVYIKISQQDKKYYCLIKFN